jgi:hypothetical protein
VEAVGRRWEFAEAGRGRRRESEKLRYCFGIAFGRDTGSISAGSSGSNWEGGFNFWAPFPDIFDGFANLFANGRVELLLKYDANINFRVPVA